MRIILYPTQEGVTWEQISAYPLFLGTVGVKTQAERRAALVLDKKDYP